MAEQISEHQQKRRTFQTIQRSSAVVVCFTALLALAVVLVACSSPPGVPAEIVVQTALPTSTIEPTFTLAPPPTDTPQPLPTATPTEPTPTATPQSLLSGRILDQDTNQPVAGATVRVGAATATTDAEGRYLLIGLPPGQYVLSVTHPDHDPGLSSIFTLAAGQDHSLDLSLFAPDSSPYPKDPMLTNPLDPNGAPTAEDAERLARLQGLTGEVMGIRETELSGKYLVNYKIGEEVRAAVAELNHDVWELTDDAGRKWWIIKVCGNLASLAPREAPIATPDPRPLPPLAEVIVDDLVVRTCASEECAEVGTFELGAQIEVIGCLADGSWCQAGLPSGRNGWCAGQSLRHLAVAEAVPVMEVVSPTTTPGSIAAQGKIAFASCQNSDCGISVINANGTGLTRLISGRVLRGAPTWSPDGEKIAFSAGAIYVMNADGSNLVSLAEGSNASEFRMPAWSPDGLRIAFTSSLDGGGIYVINADGSGLTRLTYNQPWDTALAWSPDSQYIAFHADLDLDTWPEIYVINADGSNRTLITVGNYPAWSSDGTQIAYVSVPEPGNAELYLINTDGSNPIRLTNHPAWDTNPTWSQDGQHIAFQSNRDGNPEIYVMNVDGGSLTRLTYNPAYDVYPAWSPYQIKGLE